MQKTIFFRNNPYKIFSTEATTYIHNKSRNYLRKSSKYEMISSEGNQIRPLTSYYKPSSVFSSTSKSLKSVTLSSKIYGNYIDFYSNLTQIHSFKSPGFNNYPLMQYMKYLPIKNRPLTAGNLNKEKVSFSTDISNSQHFSYMKEAKSDKKLIENKKYKFKSAKKQKDNSIKAANDFANLNQNNLYESKFLNTIKIRKIDVNNCFEEKQKNFKFFHNYLLKVNELKDIFNQNNSYRSVKFRRKTDVKKENIKMKLDIHSLCFKFFTLNNNKEKKIQKLYFPFTLIPLFYLLDFISFKVFLSEIITFNESNNCFEYIKENLLINKINEFINYINNSLEINRNYINDITYNKKEAFFPLIYDWIITKKYLNEEEEESNNYYRCFKLKIVLPKIKFSFDNLNIKINKLINKHIIAYLLNNKFKQWKKFIFFDLFSSKRFRIITNLIMLNKYNEISIKKIELNTNYKIKSKEYEFFITQIGENNSLFYTLVPFVVLILIGKNEKKFQKINLDLKESINLAKYGKHWGIINTLLKCMYLDKMKNKISFNLDLLSDKDKSALFYYIKLKNVKSFTKNNNNSKIMNLKSGLNLINNNNKTLSKDSNNIWEKEKDKFILKYKDKILEISVINFTLRRINITSNNKEEKFLIFPKKILNKIFNIKDENKLIDNSLINISLLGKYMGENNKSIIFAKESNYKSEEENMIDDADIMENAIKKEIKNEIAKKENVQKQISFSPNVFNRPNIFQSIKENNVLKNERKLEVKEKTLSKSIRVDKRLSNKYIFPKGIYFARSDKKRVSIANSNELNLNRLENISKEFIKKRSQKLNEYI